jgi:hypothetical protein
MGRVKKVKQNTNPVMKHPCCDRAWITYPYLNEIVCINCGTFRIPPPKGAIKIKKVIKKKRVAKVEIDRYG